MPKTRPPKKVKPPKDFVESMALFLKQHPEDAPPPVRGSKEHRQVVRFLKGKLAWLGYTSEDFVKDKQRELEAEKR